MKLTENSVLNLQSWDVSGAFKASYTPEKCITCRSSHQSWLTPDDQVGRGSHIVNGGLCCAGIESSMLQLSIPDKQLPIWAPILQKTKKRSRKIMFLVWIVASNMGATEIILHNWRDWDT